ncbi:MAG: tRNA (adenosine(37)-N6)-dimethylallyltransferase MiaA [Bacillota bacterium]|nr:MAG: tRNA (adenosine(37)-N6)-dimethylallyltransferase MiaA [Bacillota bacterium]
MKKVIVIVGPTASGKTKLSIALAKHYHTEIINGDSVQVYQGLNIGSAKIKEEEKEGIKHHLIDVVSPQTPYSVYAFQKDVRKLIENMHLPMIVGGTGLYIKAALYDYEFIEEKRNLEFEESIKDLSNEALYQKLIEHDPLIHIDVHNRRRLSRAYEQALLGHPRSSKTKKDERLYDALILYLDMDRQVLETRLIDRLNKQLDEGFIDEVKSLLEKDIDMNVIGYRELSSYLKGLCTLEEAKQSILSVSKKLAKKQKTWFKNQMNPIMLDALSPNLLEDAIKHIDLFIKR